MLWKWSHENSQGVRLFDVAVLMAQLLWGKEFAMGYRMILVAQVTVWYSSPKKSTDHVPSDEGL